MCVCVCVCVCVGGGGGNDPIILTLEDKKSHKANIFEVLQELESDAFVFDPGLQVFVFTTLYREEPVEVVGQLRAAAGTGDQEASQVGELQSEGMAGYKEGGTEEA